MADPAISDDLSPAAHDPYAAWRNATYRRFILGFFVAVIGGQMQTTAIAYQIYQRTGSALSLGWVGLALAIPVILLALPAGQAADTHSRRRLVMFSQIVAAFMALVLATLPLFNLSTGAWQICVYATLFLGNSAATFGRPARQAMLPQLVPQKVFPNAVTWNSSTFEIASVAGPAFGGLALMTGTSTVYILTAICSLFCVVMIWTLPEKPLTPINKAGGTRDLLAGLKFVMDRPLILSAMTLDLFAVLFGGATFLLPIYAKDILHTSELGFGILRAAPACGAFSMAFFVAHRGPFKRAGRAMLLAVIGFGAATIVFGLSTHYWLSFGALVATGCFDNVSVVVRHTLVQVLTPDTMRGRVSAVNQVFIGSSNEIGGVESSVAAEMFGTVKSAVGGGVATIVVVGLVAIIWPQLAKLGSLQSLADLSDEVPVADPLPGAAQIVAPADAAP